MSTSVTNLVSFSRPCSSCKEINRSEGKCENCQNRDGEAAVPQTPDPKATPKRRFALLHETSKACSSGGSVDEAQMDAADNEFRLANKRLKLPVGTKTCCITLQSEPGAGTEICHIVSRKKNMDSQQLRNLEFVWGLEYNGFNVDSSTNLLRMSASLHRAFDEGGWALVPWSIGIISVMMVHYQRWAKVHEMTKDLYRKHRFDKANCYGDNKSFQYFLIPLKSPRFQMPIVRLERAKFGGGPPTASEYDLHYFPYDKFPILDLPLEPHYAIWNLGTKFKEQNIEVGNYVLDDPALHPLTRYCVVFEAALKIFEIWDNIKSPTWFGTGDGGKADADNDEADNETRDVDGSSRGGRKRRRTEKSRYSSDDGRRAASSGADDIDESMDSEPEADEESSEESISDSESTDEESSDEDKVDFIESEEELVSRVEEWRGGVVIGRDDDVEKSALLPLDYLSEPQVDHVENTLLAPEVV